MRQIPEKKKSTVTVIAKDRGVEVIYIKEWFQPGFFAEYSMNVVEVDDPHLVKIKRNTFVFSFVTKLEAMITLDGEEHKVSNTIKTSCNYYPGGNIVPLEEVEGRNTEGRFDILISNIKNNSKTMKAIETRNGDWQMYERGDIML